MFSNLLEAGDASSQLHDPSGKWELGPYNPSLEN